MSFVFANWKHFALNYVLKSANMTAVNQNHIDFGVNKYKLIKVKVVGCYCGLFNEPDKI